jgi:2-succinyl-5-enolpyruvyl-6-hydroxy-3-cyclohexene-1-carboxylate synthase
LSVQATFSAALVDEWQRSGVTDAVICPGSRSTPLALALTERLHAHVRLDERSAAFFALGLAQATSRPVVVCVTSGTAAVELHPAVVEAHYGLVPLIVCTADRPPELHGIGASQTIEQDGLFGVAVRWATSPGVPTEGQEASWRPLAARAFAEAAAGPSGPGPVHLNLAYREPLTGTAGALPPGPGTEVRSLAPATTAAIPPLTDALVGRGMFVVGGASSHPADPERVAALATRLQWPVLADPRSRSRLPGTIAAADAIVRTDPTLPETVVLLGTPWLSKALGGYVSAASAAGARVIVVDPWWQWTDPTRSATEFHHVDNDTWLDAALASAEPGERSWLELWQDMEDKAQAAIAEVLASGVGEPQLARAVHAAAGASGATVVVSASMPMRDLEWFALPCDSPPRVVANRGVNGIDGVVSTALGVAASDGGCPTLALLGDLAFLHDVSGLVNLPNVPCTFVVADNGGGGIFSFLPQAEALEPTRFEDLFGTPPSSDVSAVARGFGLAVREVSTMAELDGALEATSSGSAERPGLIRVGVPTRSENVALHDRVNQAVRRALR